MTASGDPEHAGRKTVPRDFTELFENLQRMVVTDPPEALETATTALEAVDARGTIAERMRIRRKLAMAYAHTNQFEMALEVCREAEALPGADTVPIEGARIKLAAMQPLAMLDRVDDAIASGRTALQMLEAHDGGALAGRAALNIGSIYAMIGRPHDALPYFDRALGYLSDEPVLLGQIETNRGTALAALDRFEEAERAFAHAVTLLTTDEMSWAAAIAEGNLADLAARQGAISRSLRHFEASRRHLERDEAFGDLGRLNAEEAMVLATSGLTSVAREAFAEAIAMLQEHGTPSDLAMAQIAYGTALVDAGEIVEAVDLLTKTSTLIDAIEHPALYQRYLDLQARLAIARGTHDEAHRLIAQGLKVDNAPPMQRLRWTVLRADLARAMGKLDEADAILRIALSMAERAQVTPLIATLHQGLSEIARDIGEEEVANVHARKAIEAYESIRGTIQADRLRQSYHHGRLGVYRDLYLSRLGQPTANAQAEAFGVAERIRSRMLLDEMQVNSNDVESSGPVSEAERPLVEALTEHRRRLNWMYSVLADGLEPTEEQLQALREWERAAAQIADRLAILRPQFGFSAPLSLSHIQGLLEESDIILSFLAVGERMTVQIITATETTGIVDFASVATLGDLVASLQFQIGRALVHGNMSVSPARQARLQRDTDSVLTQLYDLLIAPIEPWFDGKKRLFVIPSGDLHTVPFSALLHEGTYLVDRLAIATTPGASILANMEVPEAEAKTTSASALVVGVPDSAAPELGEEATFVSERLPNSRLLLANEATRDTVLGEMPSASLIHLACHGRFDADYPAASGLLLADGWITLDRLVGLRLNQPLIVLTGCETGRVRVDQGNDLIGMMAALIAAGASGLVMSLWKTHDQAATALMDAFYDSLATGADPITALRYSQRTVRQQFAHPAYWAPFIGVHTGEKGTYP